MVRRRLALARKRARVLTAEHTLDERAIARLDEKQFGSQLLKNGVTHSLLDAPQARCLKRGQSQPWALTVSRANPSHEYLTRHHGRRRRLRRRRTIGVFDSAQCWHCTGFHAHRVFPVVPVSNAPVTTGSSPVAVYGPRTRPRHGATSRVPRHHPAPIQQQRRCQRSRRMQSRFRNRRLNLGQPQFPANSWTEGNILLAYRSICGASTARNTAASAAPPIGAIGATSNKRQR